MQNMVRVEEYVREKVVRKLFFHYVYVFFMYFICIIANEDVYKTGLAAGTLPHSLESRHCSVTFPSEWVANLTRLSR